MQCTHIRRVIRSERQSATSIEPSKRFPRNSTSSTKRRTSNDPKRQPSWSGRGVRGKRSEVRCLVAVLERSAALTSIQYQKQGFTVRRNDREARANPPARLLRLQPPGGTGAFDARLRCPPAMVLKPLRIRGATLAEPPPARYLQKICVYPLGRVLKRSYDGGLSFSA